MSLRLTGDRNQCRACRKYFNSTKAFDKHRTGRYGIDRRCLDDSEMQSKGMSKNTLGFWISERQRSSATEGLRLITASSSLRHTPKQPLFSGP